MVSRSSKKVNGPGRLTSQHGSEMSSSGISFLTWDKAGVYSEGRPSEIQRLLGWHSPPKGLGKCLAYPYLDVHGHRNGYVRLKPQNPRTDAKTGKIIKYEAPRGEAAHPYFPPDIADFADDVDKAILLTEGE
jgi:hypothetical protein